MTHGVGHAGRERRWLRVAMLGWLWVGIPIGQAEAADPTILDGLIRARVAGAWQCTADAIPELPSLPGNFSSDGSPLFESPPTYLVSFSIAGVLTSASPAAFRFAPRGQVPSVPIWHSHGVFSAQDLRRFSSTELFGVVEDDSQEEPVVTSYRIEGRDRLSFERDFSGGNMPRPALALPLSGACERIPTVDDFSEDLFLLPHLVSSGTALAASIAGSWSCDAVSLDLRSPLPEGVRIPQVARMLISFHGDGTLESNLHAAAIGQGTFDRVGLRSFASRERVATDGDFVLRGFSRYRVGDGETLRVDQSLFADPRFVEGRSESAVFPGRFLGTLEASCARVSDLP